MTPAELYERYLSLQREEWSKATDGRQNERALARLVEEALNEARAERGKLLGEIDRLRGREVMSRFTGIHIVKNPLVPKGMMVVNPSDWDRESDEVAILAGDFSTIDQAFPNIVKFTPTPRVEGQDPEC